MDGTEITFDRSVANRLRVAKVFADDNRQRINALAFNAVGEHLITSSFDDSLNIYDCLAGSHRQRVMSKKYGCSLVRFTHANDFVIHASTKENDDIRYLSLHANKYECYFVGHKQTVTSLSMSPASDNFLSTSQDNTLRLWDLRSPSCQGLLQTESPRSAPVAAYDNQGLIFAVGVNSQSINLYDVRNFEVGPFATFTSLSDQTDAVWTDLSFAPDGCSLAIATMSGQSFIVNAYEDHVIATVGSPSDSSGEPLRPAYSPDSNHLVSGSRDGALHVWSALDGSEEARLTAHHDAVACVEFNPRYMMMASADSVLALWLPDEGEGDDEEDSASAMSQ